MSLGVDSTGELCAPDKGLTPGIDQFRGKSDDRLFGHGANLTLGERLYLIFAPDETIKV
jgi:hypothetical protein